MKKYAALFIAVTMLLVPIYGYAQTPRNASSGVMTQSRTNFTNIASLGLNTQGNPGFLVLTAITPEAGDEVNEWYLWVDTANDLCMASAGTSNNNANSANFPDGDWDTFNSVCTKVGGQS